MNKLIHLIKLLLRKHKQMNFVLDLNGGLGLYLSNQKATNKMITLPYADIKIIKLIITNLKQHVEIIS